MRDAPVPDARTRARGVERRGAEAPPSSSTLGPTVQARLAPSRHGLYVGKFWCYAPATLPNGCETVLCYSCPAAGRFPEGAQEEIVLVSLSWAEYCTLRATNNSPQKFGASHENKNS
jgi:hypothetical protein